MRIQALGGYRIVVDGRDLRLRTRKEAMLLLRLALAGDAGVSRDECVGLLWPDSTEPRARHSLSEALRGIELAAQVEITRTPERLCVPTAALSFDVHDLDEAITRGDVQTCAELFKGGFLAGWYPPTAEASHWVDSIAAGIALRLEKSLRKELTKRRQATDSRGVTAAVHLLESLGVATDEDLQAAAEAEQVTAWESLRPGESIYSRIPLDREGAFVGRVEEMKALTRELERARAGELRVVLVSGEAGIGKTRTCQRLARLAALRGARLFMSTCYELEQSVAYGAITEAFADITASDFVTLKPMFRDSIPAVLPNVPGVSEQRGAAQPVGGHILLQALSALFESACRRKPALLMFDDLQWADATSCQVIHYFLRALDHQTPALIVLALRSDELWQNGAARALVRNAETLGAVPIRLAPLSEEDIRLQVHDLCPLLGTRLAEIARTAGGNPFFARELALAESSPREEGVPSVFDVIIRRVEALSELEADSLQALSVAAVPLTVPEITAITGVSASDELRAIASLEKKRFVRDDKGAVMVAHDLIRSAIYGSLSEAKKRSIHAAVATALSHRGVPAQLAHHLSLGGQKEEARRAALEAAKHARAKRDYNEEVRCLMLALENGTGDGTEMLHFITTRMMSLARFSEAASLLGHYSNQLDRGLRIRRALAQLKALSKNDIPDAYSRCDRLFEQSVAAGMGFEAVEALREKTRLSQEAGDPTLVLKTAQKLQSFGKAWPEFHVGSQARAAALLKLTSYLPEAVTSGLSELLADLGSRFDELPQEVQFTIGQVDTVNTYNQGDITKAGLKAHAVIARSRHVGDIWQELRARSLLVPIATEAGRFERARRHARFIMDYSQYGDAPWEHLAAMVNLAVSRCEAGDFSAAQELSKAGLLAERKHPMWLVKCLFDSVLGLCALATDNLDEARRRKDEVLAELPPVHEWVSDVSHVVVFLARAWVLDGQPQPALELLEEATTHAENKHRVFYWTARLELAAVKLQSGEGDDYPAVVGLRDEANRRGCKLVAWKANRILLSMGIPTPDLTAHRS